MIYFLSMLNIRSGKQLSRLLSSHPKNIYFYNRQDAKNAKEEEEYDR